MAERKLSAAEVRALGLDDGPSAPAAAKGAERPLSHEEAVALGLEEAAPAKSAGVADWLRSKAAGVADVGVRAAKSAGRLAIKGGQYSANPALMLSEMSDLSPSGVGGAALRGGGQGLTAGFSDELSGLYNAGDELGAQMRKRVGLPLGENYAKDGPVLPALVARYREGRDGERRDFARASEAQGDVYGAGKLGGGAVSSIAAPGARGAGLVGRLAGGTTLGGFLGLGNSEADLTKGDVEGAASDTLHGAATGLATQGAMEVAAAPFSMAATGFGNLKAKGAAADLANKAKAAAKDFASERGRLGGLSVGTLGDLERAEAVAASPLATPAQQAQASAFLNSPDGLALRRRANDNLLERLPSRMGELSESRAAMEAARDSAEPAAVQAASQAHLNTSMFKSEILPRADRLAGRLLPGMSLSGGIAQATGAPVTTVANLLKAPHFQYRVGQVGEAMAAPAANAMRSTAPLLTQQQMPAGGPPQASTGGYLEDFLKPKDDEQRQEDGAAHLSAGG